MSTRFFTNQADQTLLRKFRGVFESNPDIEKFDALVGFLRASGYFAVRPYLAHVDQVRILVGVNVDAIMADYQSGRRSARLCRRASARYHAGHHPFRIVRQMTPSRKRPFYLKKLAVTTVRPGALLTDVRDLILSARQTVARGVNSTLVVMYW